jgi:3-oxoadipate enol-lactonase
MGTFAREEHEFEGLIGSPSAETLAELRLRSPQLYDTLMATFGRTMSQAELSRANRELATVAMLSALGGAEPQLTLHTRAALRQGITAAELVALCEHVAGYAGYPRALNALTVIDSVIAEAGLPRPAALRRIQLADHETQVAQRGEAGPAVVLLHAISVDWRMWEPVMNQLSDGRRVFAYDIRGHGWATGAPTPTTTKDTAKDLVDVLDALGLERAHIVGLSYGGGIAQAAAVAYPERFASLALLATTDLTPTEALESRARAGETEGMAAQIAPTLTRWFTPEALAENGWGVQYARERIRRANPADWAGAWRAFKGFDVQGKLGTFEPPTLVLAGQADSSATPEIMSALAGRIPGSRYVELPNTPHMQSLERPELVADALADFLPA